MFQPKKTNKKIAFSEDKINTEIYNINFKTYSDVKKLSFVKNFIDKKYAPQEKPSFVVCSLKKHFKVKAITISNTIPVKTRA